MHIDGSAKPNPGRMATGMVLTAPHGACFSHGQVLPGMGCNNEAELRALQAGLTLAHAHGARSLRIYTDSRWLMEQLAPHAVAGQVVRPTQRLAPWLECVRPLLRGLDTVQWRWVPRHLNTEA
ncbi:MAG: ribonuclease HI family protein, partial [Comamonas sp.]